MRFLSWSVGALVAVLGLPLLSPLAHADLACQPKSAPKINVRTSTTPVAYDFSKYEKDLNGFSVDTINPYGEGVSTDVGGLMRGGITVSHTVKYETSTDRLTRQMCYYYSQIDIVIHINPTVYVAREFPQGSCKHNAILQHENQHVIIDREVVNKYAQIIGQKVLADINRQSMFGPIQASGHAAMETYIADHMKQLVSTYTDQMNAERRQRQQAHDSMAEYERVNNMCPATR